MTEEHDIRKRVKFGTKEYFLKEYFTDDFSHLENTKQVLGIIIDSENRVLLISEDEQFWSLPGGTIEPGENHVQTLKREVFEEAAVEIDETVFVPFFYLKSFEIRGDDQLFDVSQLRYISRVKSVQNFEKDPGGNIRHRKFVTLDELGKVLSWGPTNVLIRRYVENFINSGTIYNV
jgi:8-oxo-dGTP pyrophosphatase MutT (NUDIX family)